MKRRGHAIRYPSFDDSPAALVYNMLLDDHLVGSRLFGQVLDACPTLEGKTTFLAALLLQPPTDQQREWIEALGLAWRWTGELVDSRGRSEV